MKSKKSNNILTLLLTVLIICCVIVPLSGCFPTQQQSNPTEPSSVQEQETTAIQNNDSKIEVENVKLNKGKCSVKVGKTVKLKASVYPDNASDKYVDWVSDDDDIAIVNSEGLVTGKAAGVTNIIARASNGKEASCTVTVKKKTPKTNTNQTVVNYEHNDYHSPFYGIWCSASKDYSSAEKAADKLRQNGYNAAVLVSTDWSNLNKERWYVVTADEYPSESSAKAELPSVKSIYSDAYVKYSGSWQG